jgi:hypothetical protein
MYWNRRLQACPKPILKNFNQIDLVPDRSIAQLPDPRKFRDIRMILQKMPVPQRCDARSYVALH